jgi:hypothetical protein
MLAFAGGPVWAQSAAAFALRGKFTTPSLTATRSPDPGPGAAPNLRGPLNAATDPTANAAPKAAAVEVDGSAPVQIKTPAPRPLAAPAFTPLPTPGSAFAGGFPAVAPGGFAASLLPSLPRFSSGSDPAPVCRAECSKTRTLCAGNDNGECDSHWAQCIASCSSSALR